MRKRKEIIDS